MKILIIAIIAALSFSVNAKLSVSNVSGLRGDLDRNGKAMQITIFYAKNKHLLDLKVLEVKKFQLDEGQSGVAFYSKADNICEVFLIQPKRDTAAEMAVLGHEIYHCTNGNYHK